MLGGIQECSLLSCKRSQYVVGAAPFPTRHGFDGWCGGNHLVMMFNRCDKSQSTRRIITGTKIE